LLRLRELVNGTRCHHVAPKKNTNAGQSVPLRASRLKSGLNLTLGESRE
jgi:hypothetical protein